MKSIIDRKDHLSAESIFKVKRRRLFRELAKESHADESDPWLNASQRTRLQMVVRRDHVFEDSYSIFASIRDRNLRSTLSVGFLGEAGVDAGIGGVKREWYTSLSREFVNPQYGLFTRSTTADGYTFEINPNSGINTDHLRLFRFIGTIMGKALVDRCLLDAHFPRLVYKRILSKPLTFHDMATVDAQVYKSLVWLLETNLDGMDLELTFSVVRENFGALEEIELKPRGKEINVCETNKREYVDLLSAWRLTESLESQIQALRAGLARVVNPVLLQNFNENELEWLIGGIPHINALDWRKSTEYSNGYRDCNKCQVLRWFWHRHCKMCPVISWFWQLVNSWSQDMRAHLLQFVTGTSKVPYPDGFKGLRGSYGLQRFCIVRVSDPARLPQAQTCFNKILLPNYNSYEELESKLTTAIFETGNQFHLH